MKDRFSRTLVALLLAVFMTTPAFPQTSPNPQDAKAVAKAAAEAEKAAKKKAEADKKAAEKKAKEEEKLAKEEEKLAKEAAKNAPKKKNMDLENIGNREINGGFGLMKMSLESEIALGRQTAKELEAAVTLVQDPVITEYVNRVGQNIVRNSDAKVPFTIKVIDSEEINAVSLPGGFFYVNTGLILAADEEAELAAVMAHEIAHVTARHGAEQQQKASLINIAAIPLMIFGGGIPGMILQQAAQIGVPLTFLHFSRSHEEEADWLGLQYMYTAGYDPGASVSFFEKLQARESAKRKVSGLFSSHPQTEDRVAETKTNIENFLPPKEQYLVTTSEFSKIKALLTRLEDERTPSERDRAPSLRRPAPSRRTTSEDTRDSTKEGEAGETSSDDDAPPVLRRPQDRPQ